ncbi:MAG: histidine kinase [Cyclobacteriaceae bacterium]
MSSSKKKILLHVLFWVAYTAIFTIVDGGYNNRFDRAFYIELAHLPLRLIVVYVNILIFFPKLLLKGRYYTYAIVTVLSLLLASFVQRAIMFYYVAPVLYPNTSDVVNYFIPYKLLQAGVIINSPLIFMLGFSVLHHVFKLREKTELLEREKLQSELKFLKSQLNPHFFFNTLNSLYGLTQERSDRAPEVVLKLSELMSFVIYESDKEKLPLATELKYIRNYIELEEVRYGARFTCNLSIEGNTDVLLPPLVLLPFVENSFKHGIHQETEHGFINIKVHVKDELLKFSIENSIADTMRTKLEAAGGLGISNTKRRLDLLFPSGYILHHGKKGDKYIVELEIKLITDK